MRSLVLYKKETCPFCRKVMGFISSAGRTDVLYRDIVEDSDAADELVRVGGKRQVPCLFIDGKPLYGRHGSRGTGTKVQRVCALVKEAF